MYYVPTQIHPNWLLTPLGYTYVYRTPLYTYWYLDSASRQKMQKLLKIWNISNSFQSNAMRKCMLISLSIWPWDSLKVNYCSSTKTIENNNHDKYFCIIHFDQYMIALNRSMRNIIQKMHENFVCNLISTGFTE